MDCSDLPSQVLDVGFHLQTVAAQCSYVAQNTHRVVSELSTQLEESRQNVALAGDQVRLVEASLVAQDIVNQVVQQEWEDALCQAEDIVHVSRCASSFSKLHW